MKRLVTAIILACVMAAGAFAPASAFLDKTRFLAHLGVAYFAFHHWVLKPYEQGAFGSGAPHRTAALVKGGVALLFAVHEAHVSERIAQKSKDPLLQKLDGGVASLMNSFQAVGSRLKSGTPDPQGIDALNQQTTSLNADASAGGAPIKDVSAPIPGV